MNAVAARYLARYGSPPPLTLHASLPMPPTDLISRLEHEGHRLVAWLRQSDLTELLWKPSEARWSMLEVVGHLCDEERDDFRARVRMTLAGTTPWPPIDPEAWVPANGWQARDPFGAIDEFEAERRASIEWLRGLKEPDWSRTYEHPQVGTITAADLLASWVAHDLLHGKQLARIQSEAFAAGARPLSVKYADPDLG